MYNHKLQFADQLFEAAMTFPANTSATATNPMRVGGANGNLAITVVGADTDVLLADTKIFTLSYTEATTESGVYAAANPAVSSVYTASGAYAPAVGIVMNRLVLPPDAGPWIKAVLATDDAAADGTVDVFLEYLAN